MEGRHLNASCISFGVRTPLWGSETWSQVGSARFLGYSPQLPYLKVTSSFSSVPLRSSTQLCVKYTWASTQLLNFGARVPVASSVALVPCSQTPLRFATKGSPRKWVPGGSLASFSVDLNFPLQEKILATLWISTFWLQESWRYFFFCKFKDKYFVNIHHQPNCFS